MALSADLYHRPEPVILESFSFQNAAIDPATLDRLADAELALGRHRQAERLSWFAASLREAGQ
jgi:hypothetical protein